MAWSNIWLLSGRRPTAITEDYKAIAFSSYAYRWAYYLSGRKAPPTAGTQTFITTTRDGSAQTNHSSCSIQLGTYVKSTRFDLFPGLPPPDRHLHAAAQTDATYPERPEECCVDHGRRRTRLNREAAPTGGYRCTRHKRCHDLPNYIVQFPSHRFGY